MTAPEFSRVVNLSHCDGREIELIASAEECARLAERFELVRIEALHAALLLTRRGDEIEANGNFEARFVQTCAVSAEDLPVAVSEPLSLCFVPASAAIPASEEEVEIASDEPDEIEYTGTSIDLGEAVAQSLALAIDPFAVGPEAQAVREKLRGEMDSPFAALAALRRKPEGEAD